MGRASGNPFTTVKESGLGRFIDRLSSQIEILQKAYANSPQSPELSYVKTQIQSLADALNVVKTKILSAFELGKKPGLFTLSEIQKNLETLSKQYLNVLWTPEYAVISAIEENFDKIYDKAAKGIRKIDDKTMGTFRDAFKRQLRNENIYELALRIPGVTLESVLEKIDQLVDLYDFSEKPKPEIFKAALIKSLEINFNYQFSVSHPMGAALMMELWFSLNSLPQTIDELLSFFDPEAFNLSIPFRMTFEFQPGQGNDHYYTYEITKDGKKKSINLQSELKERWAVVETTLRESLTHYLTQCEIKSVSLSDQVDGLEAKEQGRWAKAHQSLNEFYTEHDQSARFLHEPSFQQSQPAEQYRIIQIRMNKVQALMADMDRSLHELQQKIANPTSHFEEQQAVLLNFFVVSQKKRALLEEQSRLLKLEPLVLKQWYESELGFHQKAKEANEQKLASISRDLSLIVSFRPDFDSRNVPKQQVPLLEEGLQLTSSHSQKLKSFAVEIEQLGVIESKSDLSPLHRAYPRLSQEISEIHQANQEKRKALSDEMPAVHTHIEKCREEMLLELKKAQLAIAFAESMSSTNIETIKQHYEEKQKQLQEEEKQLQALIQKASELDKNLSAKDLQSKDSSSRISQSTENLSSKWKSVKQSALIIAAAIHAIDGTSVSTDFKTIADLSTFKRTAEVKGTLFNQAVEANKTPIDPTSLKDDLAVLAQIDKCFQGNKLTINFSDMYDISRFKVGFLTSNTESFKKLMFFLEATDKECQDLLLFQSRQASLKTDTNTYFDAIILFQELCAKKRQTLQKKELALKAQLISQMGEEQNIFNSLYTEIQTLTDILDSEQQTLPSVEKNKVLLTQAKETTKKEIATIEKTVDELKRAVTTLKLIIELIEGNAALGEKLRQTTTPETIQALYDDYYSLLTRHEALLSELNGMTNPQAYDANKASIEKQLAVNLEQLRVRAREWIDQYHVEEQKTATPLQTELALQIQSSKKNNQSTEAIDIRLTEASTLLSKYDELSQQLGGLNTKREEFAAKLDGLKDSVLSNEFVKSNALTAVFEEKKKLEEQLLADNQFLLKEISTRINEYTKLLKFDFNSLDDRKEQERLRNELNGYLDKVNSKLPALCTLLESAFKEKIQEVITPLNEAIRNAEDTMRCNQHVLDETHTRLSHRELLVDNYIDSFDQYLKKRSQTYFLKDRIYSPDAKQRNAYIGRLNLKLTEFKQKGDLDALNSLYLEVEFGRDSFPGLTLRPLLRRLLVALQNCKEELQQDENKRTKTSNDYDEAQQRLKSRSNDEFANKLLAVYAKIKMMEDYIPKLKNRPQMARTVRDLSFSLNERLTDFVLTHVNKDTEQSPVSKNQLNCFIKEMKDVLHSEDDKMHSERSWWAPVAANIVAALASLGFALGFKLIDSKRTQGYASLFMDKTQREKNVEEVDEALTQLAAPTA